MTRSAPTWCAAASALATVLLLTACAQQGDFGRPAPSAWNAFVDTTGTVAATSRGEPASSFPFTDDERTLRDRAWRFLMPADSRAAFENVLANLTRARVLPPAWSLRSTDSYHATIVSESFRSPYSRYRRLSDDATADGRLIPPFASIAARVLEADAFRLRSLPFAKNLDEADLRDAAMRVAENRCLVAWVRLEAGQRVLAYRFALEHLVVEMPGREAAATERTITFFDARRALLFGLITPDTEARCGLAPSAPPVAGLAEPLSAKY